MTALKRDRDELISRLMAERWSRREAELAVLAAAKAWREGVRAQRMVDVALLDAVDALRAIEEAT